jgi:hypothetical protein
MQMILNVIPTSMLKKSLFLSVKALNVIIGHELLYMNNQGKQRNIIYDAQYALWPEPLIYEALSTLLISLLLQSSLPEAPIFFNYSVRCQICQRTIGK